MIGSLFSLLSLGAVVYTFERYHRGPGEEVLYGTWEVRGYFVDDPMYFRFDPDHRFCMGSASDGKFIPGIAGRWYAGGRSIYIRFTDDGIDARRPLILHIVDIQDDALQIRYGREGEVTTYRRVRLDSANASNHAMQRTASKPAIHLMSVCHPPVAFEPRFTGLAVADLGSR